LIGGKYIDRTVVANNHISSFYRDITSIGMVALMLGCFELERREI
jgi:hypothetical protein